MRRALLVVSLLAGSAHAQSPADGPATAPRAAKAAPGPHKEGEYGGVAPGQAPRDGRPKKLPAKGTLSWIGFEAKDGGAQVFLQSVAPFEVSQRVEGASLVVHVDLTKLGGNTRRPLETRYFDSPLARISARAVKASKGGKGRPAQGGGIDIRFAFKSPKDVREATMRAAAEADGMYYVYLSFPEGAGAAGGQD